MAQTRPLTEDERSRVKHFLQYPDWSALAYSIQLGYPAASQPLYLVEGAFSRITNPAVETVRRDLCQLEAIEAQLGSARGRLKATELGNLKLNPNELTDLRRELVWWALTLASDGGRYRSSVAFLRCSAASTFRYSV
jgi:hypothetical protein